MDIEIRGAGADDAEAAIGLIASADEEAILELSGKASLHEAITYYVKNFSRTDVYFSFKNVLVAQSAGQVIACILYFPGAHEERFARIEGENGSFIREACDDEMYIDSLAVDPSCRRQGIAGKLVRGVIVEARALGLERVGLLADVSNPNLAKFYEGLGFEETDRIYRNGGLYAKMTLKMSC